MKAVVDAAVKLREFATGNPLAAALIIMWVVTIVAVFVRDRLWNARVNDLERALTALEFDRSRILSQFENPIGENLEALCKDVMIMQQATSGALDAVSKEIPQYFGWASISQILLFTSSILFEFYYLYSGLNLSRSSKVVDNTLIITALNFLSKQHPVTSLILSLWTLLRAAAAWIGFLDRNSFVVDTFRLLLGLYIASIISFVGINLGGIRKYLPQDMASWQQSLQQSSWWLWLVGRALGLHNPAVANRNLIWLVVYTVGMYPIRYFFYYRTQVCAFDTRNHVFFINTIMHLLLLVIAGLLFYTPVIILNIHRLQQEAEQADVNNTNKPTWIVSLLRSIVVASMTSVYKLCSDQQTLGLSIFFIIASLVIFVLRFFYFLWTGKCTWYAWLVSWMFLHIAIAVVLFSLPGLNFLMQGLKLHKIVRKSFVEKFREGLLLVKPDATTGNDESTISTEDDKKERDVQGPAETAKEGETTPTGSSNTMTVEEARILGEQYYEQTVLTAILYSYFTDLSFLKPEGEGEKAKDKPKKNEADKDNEASEEQQQLEDQELYQVFNLVLQSDLMTMDGEDSAPSDVNATDGSDENGESNNSNEKSSNAHKSSDSTTNNDTSDYENHDKLD